METPAKLRWYQFSLQRLFAALTLPAVGLGVWLLCIGPAERQRKGVEMVERLEGEVTYSDIPPDESWPIRQLRKYLPRDYFDSVVEINFHAAPATDSDLENLRGFRSLRKLNLAGTQVTDAGLVHLQEFPELEDLELSLLPVTDVGLSNIRGLIHLEVLQLFATRVTDAGMPHLRRLTNLRRLHLGVTQVTDDGVRHLGELKQLEVVVLDRTDVTAAGVAELRKTLDPYCDIVPFGRSQEVETYIPPPEVSR